LLPSDSTDAFYASVLLDSLFLEATFQFRPELSILESFIYNSEQAEVTGLPTPQFNTFISAHSPLCAKSFQRLICARSKGNGFQGNLHRAEVIINSLEGLL